MSNTSGSLALALVLVLPAAACSGSFGLSLTATVTTDGVVDPEPPSSCTFSSGGGIGVFTVSPGNAGVSAEPFDVDAPYDAEKLTVTITVGDEELAEDSWNTVDITPDFAETLTATSGTSELVVSVKGVDSCGD